LKLIDFGAMCGFGVCGFRLQTIPFRHDLLQTAAQIVKMCSALLQQLLELVLRGKSGLERVDLADGLLELLFNGYHLMARVDRLHWGFRLSG
jgi:hypothetical protein